MRHIGYVATVKMMNIGFPSSIMRGAYVTGPYTLAALLTGADEAALATIQNPDELYELCKFTTAKIQEYIRLPIVSGAQMICILEPSAVMLGPDQIEQFTAQFVRQINESCLFTDVATIYHICGKSMHLIDKMVESGINGLSLDALEIGVDLEAVAKRVPENVVIIGNISPIGYILHGKPNEVEKEVTDLMRLMKPYPISLQLCIENRF